MKCVTVKPSKIFGSTCAVPSKSHTMRALVFALMGRGKSTIRKYLVSPDVSAMVDAIRLFGADVSVTDELISVVGVGGRPCVPSNVINAGNSGQVLRFSVGIAALLDGYTVITGDESIRKRRPIKPMLDGLSNRGLLAASTKLDGHAPVVIRGSLNPGLIKLDGSDSQPVSSLLFALSFLEGESEIYVTNPGEKPWIDLTIEWMKRLNIDVHNTNYERYVVSGNAVYDGFDVTIPGDFSSATYPIAAAMVTRGGVDIFGLDGGEVQADKKFVELAKAMGAHITEEEERYQIHMPERRPIRGISKIDINDCIDVLPLLAVLACYASNCTEIFGAGIARCKESDRIKAISTELRKMGANIEEKDEGMIVYPSRLRGAEMSAHDDHRIAMSLVVAALGADTESVISGVECIEKSYKNFFNHFSSIGAQIE